MASYRFTVVIEQDENGYFAFCPELQGCSTQGSSFEEALKNIEDAIYLHIEVGFFLARKVAGHKIYKNAEGKRVTVLAHCSPFTTHFSILTIYFSPFTRHSLLITV